MTSTQAQRLRFGILAARHALERWRLTEGQVDDLEGMELAGWIVGDWGTQRAFDQEYKAHGLRAAELRKKWMA